MATVSIRIPTMLTRFTDDEGVIEVEAETFDDAIEALLEAHPDLEGLLFRKGRDLRPHLQFFYGDRNVEWLDDSNPELSDGDEITILQAVSGG